MSVLYIKCPVTGKDVPTGFDIDAVSFADPTGTIDNIRFGNCPYCGKEHVWSKKDAFFKK
jgi:endogenous inhibitor of DNA gyrase (YacG/DUF329 family)